MTHPTTLALGPNPRILFLSADPQALRAPAGRRQLTLDQAGALRDDVSTDEITPVHIMSHYDDRLARFPYTGFKAGGETPIGAGAVQAGGFVVTVAGGRYGKGSSREHSPAAEKLAGIRLVIARSFERIYRQNADNIGLFTSTDFGLVERIQRGEAIPLEELLAGPRRRWRPASCAAAACCASGRRTCARRVPAIPAGSDAAAAPCSRRSCDGTCWPRPSPPRTRNRAKAPSCAPTGASSTSTTPAWPRTCCTARSAVRWHCTSRNPSWCSRTTPRTWTRAPRTCAPGWCRTCGPCARPSATSRADYGLRTHRTLTDEEALRDDGSNVAGISHAMMAEHYALPGQVVVGTDSHTPHSGALGCVAFGVGTTDMANAFVTGAVRMTMPQLLRVELEGDVPCGVTAKDIVLHLLALPAIRGGGGVGKVFEFAGDAVRALTTDERATLTNMTAELGGLTGIVAPDARNRALPAGAARPGIRHRTLDAERPRALTTPRRFTSTAAASARSSRRRATPATASRSTSSAAR